MAVIYVVEDDESIREIETIALKNSGHEVIGFSDATTFLKRTEAIIPDLVLLDIMLPDLNGNEIDVNDGNTWINICPINADVQIEGSVMAEDANVINKV